MYWIISDEPKDAISGTYINGLLLGSSLEITGNILCAGSSVIGDAPKFYFKIFYEYSRIGLITDVINVSSTGQNLFVVSKRLKNHLDQSTKNVEFIPIIFLEEEFNEDYFIVNPLIKIDCMDNENSEYIPIDRRTDDTIYKIDSLVLDESKIPQDVNLFLLGRTNLSVIIISDGLKNELETRFTGCNFFSPSELIL